jgi:hypothetical protein
MVTIVVFYCFIGPKLLDDLPFHAMKTILLKKILETLKEIEIRKTFAV